MKLAPLPPLNTVDIHIKYDGNNDSIYSMPYISRNKGFL